MKPQSAGRKREDECLLMMSGEPAGWTVAKFVQRAKPSKTKRVSLRIMKFSPKIALKSLAVALGAVFLSLPATAGENPGGERRERLQQGADRMAGELGLSETQRNQIQELARQEKAELDALRDAAPAKEDRRAKAHEIREKYRAQRQAVLTPDQRAKADKMRGKFAKHRDRMERREERRAGFRD